MPENTLEAVRTAHSGPKRFQRKRTAGWKMPEGAVYVGRGSKWGNPFVIQIAPKGMVGAYPQTNMRYAVLDSRPDAPRGNYKLFPTFHDAARYAVNMFLTAVMHKLEKDPDFANLAGKDLACWCAESNPCHGDTILKWVNAPEIEA